MVLPELSCVFLPIEVLCDSMRELSSIKTSLRVSDAPLPVSKSTLSKDKNLEAWKSSVAGAPLASICEIVFLH